jgi:hypothetical protein
MKQFAAALLILGAAAIAQNPPAPPVEVGIAKLPALTLQSVTQNQAADRWVAVLVQPDNPKVTVTLTHWDKPSLRMMLTAYLVQFAGPGWPDSQAKADQFFAK